MKYSYLAILNPNFYPRPYFFLKCCGVPTYYLRTFIGYWKNPQKTLGGRVDTQRNTAASSGDLLRVVYNCPRQNRTLLLDSFIYELLYAPYISKIRSNGVIVMNPHGVYAAKIAGKKAIVDLMDLWSCRLDALQLNVFDFRMLRKADLILAWSKAIAALLRSIGLRRVEYLPYGIDLKDFDPLVVSPQIFLDKYKIDSAIVRIVYSGGMWKVSGKDVLGVEKLLRAFKRVEEKRRDVVLILQTSGEVVELAKSVGIRSVVYVKRTQKPNDPLRLSMLRSADVLVLTASKYPAVYLAERTTMFQFMSSGNAILAEDTPGVRGVLRHGETAYLVPVDSSEKLAEGIIELIKDDALRRYIGRKARDLLEREYTWDVLGEKARRLLI